MPTSLESFALFTISSRGVKSIHWSEDIFDGFCYMCVVHDKNISIWKVEGHSPKLTFKQVRKVNIQPIQQGKKLFRHLALFSLRTESDNPDATCELSP